MEEIATTRHVHSRLGRILFIRVLAFSIVLTLFFTAIQAFLDYRTRVALVKDNLEQIDNLYHKGIEAALWNFDQNILTAQIEGVLNMPYITYAAIIDNNTIRYERGIRKHAGVIIREFPLAHDHLGKSVFLGTLFVQADTSNIIHDVINNIGCGFMFLLITVAFTAFFIVWIFESKVTRHLYTLANYFRTPASDIEQMATPLKLDKKRSNDELDILVDSFNTLRESLASSYLQLRQSRDQYSMLYNKTPILLHSINRSGVIVEVNDHWLKTLGYEREEVIGRKVTDFCTEASMKYSLKVVQPAFFRDGIIRNVAFQFVKKNGEVVDVLVSATAERNAAGDVIRSLAVIEDITERRQAEEALLERDERLRQAVRVSQIGIFDHDQRTDAIYWSPQQRIIHGWGPDEPVSLPAYLDLVHPEDIESVAAAVRRAHDPAGDGIWDVEHRIIRRDGSVRWLKERSQTFFEGEGDARRPVRTIGAVLDITERKKTEEEQQKLVSVIEMSRDFIGIADLLGRILYMNAAGLKLVGLDSVEDCGKKVISDFFMETDHSRLEKEILPTIFETGTGTWTGELALRHFKTEMPIPVEMNIFIIKDRKNDKPIALANISRDITEQKHAEEEKKKLQALLLHVQKMESIGQLAGGIAHDFNNILAAIVGYGNILEMKMQVDDPLRTYLNQILAGAERGASLTQSLLAFSRKQVINPKNLDLNESIRKVEKFLTRTIGEDIVLSISLSEESLTVFVDPTQIEQVLMNLATNARDAMPKGGRLMIETGRLMLDDEYVRTHGFGFPGYYAVLTVSDTGEGMDEQTQQKIFEPFFTTKELGKGTGLGLAIVYGIVKQNNGYINVYSQIGKGTTFKIYIPIVSAQAREDRPLEVQSSLRGGTETILLAEDNEAVRLMNRDVLQEFGYTVIEAADGEEALQKFREHRDRINLFILDVIMPKKNGREVFEEARRSNPNLKVIFTSGYPADLIQKEGVLEKGLHFLSKPSSPQALLQTVREVLDQ